MPAGLIRISATRGEGLAAWADWLQQGLAKQQAKRAETVDHLKQRIAELEHQLAKR